MENILCVMLAIAIASYICLGIGHVQPDYFTNGFMTKGVGGFVLASIYLTFATGGAQYVVNACADGWLPKKLAEKNKKFGTYHYILFVF